MTTRSLSCKTVFLMSAVLLAGLAVSSVAEADGTVVVFSDAGTTNSSVSYAAAETGAVSHLVADMSEGVYAVSQDGVEMGHFNCYDVSSTKPDGNPGDNTVFFTSDGGGTFDIVWISDITGSTRPAAPIILTDGGNGPGEDFTVSSSSLTLDGSCDADVSMIEVNGSTAGVSYTEGQTTWSYTSSLAEGANVFSVTATSLDEQTSDADTITVTYLPPSQPDEMPPPVITYDGGNGPGADFTTTSDGLILTGTCNPSTVKLTVNGWFPVTDYTAGETTWARSITLGEGENVISVTAEDSLGNESAPDTVVITVDTTALASPIITTNDGQGYTTAVSSVTVSGTCSADASEIRVNGSAANVTYSAGQTSWSYDGTLTEGDNAFSVTALDSMSNVSAADTITITLDTTAPAAPVITSDGGQGTGADYTTATSAVTLAGTCADDTDEIRVNGAAANVTYSAGQTNWSYAGTLTEGDNAFSVTALDSMANVSAADTITITLDTTAPAVPTITSDGGQGQGQDYLTNSAGLSLAGTCGPDATSILVNGSKTGVTYSAGSTNWSFATTLVDGANTFSVTARNTLGIESEADFITVTLDTTPPSSIRPVPITP